MAQDRPEFTGQVAIITGGSSGIGLALGKALARQGASLWLVARREAQLAAAREALLQAGGTVETISADVSDPDQAWQAVQQVEQQAGQIDYLFNSAGITRPGYISELDLDIFRSLMDVNYFGMVYMTKGVLPGMIRRRSGYIVNVASFGSVIAYVGYGAYAPTKFAVRAFTDVLRGEMKAYNINVSIVYPVDTDTPQLAGEEPYKPVETRAFSKWGVIQSPETVADSILKGVRRRRYVITTGPLYRFYYRLFAALAEGINPILDFLSARARNNKEIN
jgi:3-dehydrosphinganine reductase